MTKSWLSTVAPARLLLTCLWLWFGVLKIIDAPDTAQAARGDVLDYLQSPSLVQMAGWLEIAIGFALMTPWWAVALHASISLNFIFVAYLILRLLLTGTTEGCGCLGGREIPALAHFCLLFGMALVGIAALPSPHRTA